MTTAIHFFDLDGTLWNVGSKVWIIHKEKPEFPLLTLDYAEFRKIQNGHYIKDGLKIDYNNKTFFISNEIFNKINKIRKSEIEYLGI